MLSEKTAIELHFTLHIFGQEIPFGLVPKFAPGMQPILDTPLNELTEEQARILIDDMVDQRRQFFKEEMYGNEGKQDNHPSTIN